jgi:hypothetical protein
MANFISRLSGGITGFIAGAVAAVVAIPLIFAGYANRMSVTSGMSEHDHMPSRFGLLGIALTIFITAPIATVIQCLSLPFICAAEGASKGFTASLSAVYSGALKEPLESIAYNPEIEREKKMDEENAEIHAAEAEKAKQEKKTRQATIARNNILLARVTSLPEPAYREELLQAAEVAAAKDIINQIDDKKEQQDMEKKLSHYQKYVASLPPSCEPITLESTKEEGGQPNKYRYFEKTYDIETYKKHIISCTEQGESAENVGFENKTVKMHKGFADSIVDFIHEIRDKLKNLNKKSENKNSDVSNMVKVGLYRERKEEDNEMQPGMPSPSQMQNAIAINPLPEGEVEKLRGPAPQ